LPGQPPTTAEQSGPAKPKSHVHSEFRQTPWPVQFDGQSGAAIEQSSPPKPGSQAQRPDGEQIPWPEQFEEQSCSTNWHEPPAYPRSQWHAPYTHAPWPEQSPGHAETSIEQSSPA